MEAGEEGGTLRWGGWRGRFFLQKNIDGGFEYQNLKGLFVKKPRNGVDRSRAMDRTASVALLFSGDTCRSVDSWVLPGLPLHSV